MPSSYSQYLTPFDAQFTSYVKVTLRFEARRLMQREERSRIREVPVDFSEEATANLSGAEDKESLAQTLEDVITNPALWQAVRSLTPAQRRLLTALVIEDQPERQIASRLGVTQQAVSKMKKQALWKIRTHLSAS